METYIVGFDGKWQEEFGDLDDAIAWAEDVAQTGRTVEVIKRRWLVHSFVTGFPESERERLKAKWSSWGRESLTLSINAEVIRPF